MLANSYHCKPKDILLQVEGNPKDFDLDKEKLYFHMAYVIDFSLHSKKLLVYLWAGPLLCEEARNIQEIPYYYSMTFLPPVQANM